MYGEISVRDSKLTFECRDISVDTLSLVPRLRLCLDVRLLSRGPGQPGYSITVDIERGELKITTKEGSHPLYLYVGYFIPEKRTHTLSSGDSVTICMYADLDHYRLARIEKIREGGDIKGYVVLYVTIKMETEVRFEHSWVQIRIPKSDWVEEFLPQLKYKEVFLVEMPKLERPELSDAITKINEAWRMYSMGEYDKVLVECRKALESLETTIKNMGFQVKSEEEGKEKTVPDWGGALGHKEMGELIKVIVQKLFGFLAPAAHAGKSINREDAELAIMFTYALINFFAKKLPHGQ